MANPMYVSRHQRRFIDGAPYSSGSKRTAVPRYSKPLGLVMTNPAFRSG
jgi:hypothetical protein